MRIETKSALTALAFIAACDNSPMYTNKELELANCAKEPGHGSYSTTIDKIRDIKVETVSPTAMREGFNPDVIENPKSTTGLLIPLKDDRNYMLRIEPNKNKASNVKIDIFCKDVK